MIEFWIADLISDESTFSVNTPAGDWIFKQRDDYAELIATLENGQCANTYYAYNQSIDMKSGDREVESSIRDLIRICLVLSFVTSKCVTPSGTTNASDLKFL